VWVGGEGSSAHGRRGALFMEGENMKAEGLICSAIFIKQNTKTVRYHYGGWSKEVNSCILILSYMVYL
jgi:hypothetical protein